jgi:hypothetical protein
MRVYKFIDAQYGLKSLVEKRLKISRFDDLNDPFELIPYNLKNRQHRWALKATRSQLGQNNGMLCFSSTWRDPVLWAHYAEKHQGLCIGFELPKRRYERVQYVATRLPFPKFFAMEDIQVARVILYTKFDSWQYEKEVRVFTDLKDKDEDGRYYADFGDMLKPFIVIAGARCKLSRGDIINALGPWEKQVELIKARPGFTKFGIVKDERGFQRG